MATIMSDQNIKKYESALDSFRISISNLKTKNECLRKTLSSNISNQFESEYTKGKNEITKLKNILSVLDGSTRDLNALCASANAYIFKLKQNNASTSARTSSNSTGTVKPTSGNSSTKTTTTSARTSSNSTGTVKSTSGNSSTKTTTTTKKTTTKTTGSNSVTKRKTTGSNSR